MKALLKKAVFSRALLAGVMVGLATAVVVLVFQEIYRERTLFNGGFFISPAYIFALIPMVSALAGCLYYVCRHYFRNATLWFVLFCAVLLASLIVTTIADTSGNTGPLFSGIRGMYIGIETIVFLLAAIFIPLFIKHPDFWYDDTL